MIVLVQVYLYFGKTWLNKIYIDDLNIEYEITKYKENAILMSKVSVPEGVTILWALKPVQNANNQNNKSHLDWKEIQMKRDESLHPRGFQSQKRKKICFQYSLLFKHECLLDRTLERIKQNIFVRTTTNITHRKWRWEGIIYEWGLGTGYGHVEAHNALLKRALTNVTWTSIKLL